MQSNIVSLLYRFFGDLGAAVAAAVVVVVVVVVGGWEGTGGGTADFVDVGDVGLDWTVKGEEITDVGFIDVQIVGWRSVAIEACGWNNAPNWLVVVLPVAGSNIGLKRDEPKGKLWKDDWRLNDNISASWFSSFWLLPNHWRRSDGIINTIINIVSVIRRTIQNAATIVFVKIRLSNVYGSIILE